MRSIIICRFSQVLEREALVHIYNLLKPNIKSFNNERRQQPKRAKNSGGLASIDYQIFVFMMLLCARARELRCQSYSRIAIRKKAFLEISQSTLNFGPIERNMHLTCKGI